jgi:hypothetical protein
MPHSAPFHRPRFERSNESYICLRAKRPPPTNHLDFNISFLPPPSRPSLVLACLSQDALLPPCLFVSRSGVLHVLLPPLHPLSQLVDLLSSFPSPLIPPSSRVAVPTLAHQRSLPARINDGLQNANGTNYGFAGEARANIAARAFSTYVCSLPSGLSLLSSQSDSMRWRGGSL